MAKISTDYLEWSVPKALVLLLFTMVMGLVLSRSIYFVSLNIFDHQISFVALSLLCAPLLTLPFIYLKLGADSTFDDRAYVQTAGISTVLKHVIIGVAVSVLFAVVSLGLRGAAPDILIALFGIVYSVVAGVFTVAYLAREYYDEGVNPFLAGLLHRP